MVSIKGSIIQNNKIESNRGNGRMFREVMIYEDPKWNTRGEGSFP